MPVRQIHTINWPDGRQTYHADGSYRDDFVDGRLPVFLPGISLERRLDDNSAEFDREYKAHFG